MLDAGQMSPPNAPAVPVSDTKPVPPPDFAPRPIKLGPDYAAGVAFDPPAPPKVRYYTVLVMWCYRPDEPRHQVVRTPGPAVGDAVALAFAEIEKTHKSCTITGAKAWPASTRQMPAPGDDR